MSPTSSLFTLLESATKQIVILKLKIDGLERSVKYGDDEIERLEVKLAEYEYEAPGPVV